MIPYSTFMNGGNKIMNAVGWVSLTAFCWSSCQPYDRITKIETGLAQQDSAALTLSGLLIDVANDGVSSFGHCYGLDTPLSIQNTVVAAVGAAQQGAFNTQPQDLILDTTYHYRSFAINSDGEVVYGRHQSFTTPSTSLSINIQSANLISQGNLQTKAYLLNPFRTQIIKYGHCIRLGGIPTVHDVRSEYGPSNSSPSFQSDFQNLYAGQVYWVRAYAITADNRIFYSDTLSSVSPLYQVRTDTANLQNNEITMYGTLLQMGLDPIVDHGFCYSLQTSNPNLNHSTLSLGSLTQLGPFTASVVPPNSGQTLYYRSYIVFGNQIVYGQIKFIAL